MTGTRLLEYLGLRRAPGTTRTPADRVWTAVILVVIFVGLFLTRDFGFLSQMAIMVPVAVVVGVAFAAVMVALANRRRPDHGDAPVDEI